MSLTTEAQVIEAAIEQVKKGFDAGAYLVGREGYSVEFAGPDVVATCAIGGVEQALWKETGKVLGPNKRMKFRTNSTYGRIMRRLNRIAREKYPTDPEGTTVLNLEDITFWGSELAAKRRTLKVMRLALDEIKGG